MFHETAGLRLCPIATRRNWNRSASTCPYTIGLKPVITDLEAAGLKILREIDQPLAVMLDGQNLDAGGGYTLDNCVWSFKELSNFAVDESVQTDSAARCDQKDVSAVENRYTIARARGFESSAI